MTEDSKGKDKKTKKKKKRALQPRRSNESLDGSLDQLLTKATLLCTRLIRKRFMVPMEYLSRNLFIALLRKSEEEYGLLSHGYIIYNWKKIPEELEKALLTSIATCHQLASSSSLAQPTCKWQKKAAMKRQIISLTGNGDGQDSSSVSNKGHFVVYTADKTRFTVPLEYLSKSFFRELLRMSESLESQRMDLSQCLVHFSVTSLSLAISCPTLTTAPYMFINAYKNVLAVAVATEYSFPQVDKVKEYLKDPSKFALVASAAAAKEEEKKEEPADEPDDDLGFSLFD
ncbi:hypothetical protein Ddye_004256 [Dipteronia dyeriana]|uniref:Ribosomal protein L10 n=1 Tax=Dipteronia dyeriana TaxID=168575 RepID=A0AAE0CW24_9ROSI|nr:hypothetical protein Ddye_004256 [Dipteronia dyeriana]